MREHKTNQVAEESGVGQIDLIPVIRVQSGSLVLRDLILQLDLVDRLASCLEDVEMSQTNKSGPMWGWILPNKQRHRCACDG